MTTRFIIEYLKELRVQGKTIILSAHNLAQVEEICDRVMILKHGKIVVLGTMPELREQFGSIRYEIWYIWPEDQVPDIKAEQSGKLWMSVAHSIEELNGITGMVSNGGGTVERIESKFPSLEEILVKIGK
jgi:ABC-2 type transport system ATP-binding protein